MIFEKQSVPLTPKYGKKYFCVRHVNYSIGSFRLACYLDGFGEIPWVFRMLI